MDHVGKLDELRLLNLNHDFSLDITAFRQQPRLQITDLSTEETLVELRHAVPLIDLILAWINTAEEHLLLTFR